MFIASQNVLSVVKGCNIEIAKDQLETDKLKSGRGKGEGQSGRREKNSDHKCNNTALLRFITRAEQGL